MADATHWPGTWMIPSPEHLKGNHAGIIQDEDAEWINVNFEYPEPTNDDWVGFFHQQSSDLKAQPVKIQKATWMADATHWHGTWMIPSPEHLKGNHAGIIQNEDAEWITVNFEYPEPINDGWVGFFTPAKFR